MEFKLWKSLGDIENKYRLGIHNYWDKIPKGYDKINNMDSLVYYSIRYGISFAVNKEVDYHVYMNKNLTF